MRTCILIFLFILYTYSGNTQTPVIIKITNHQGSPLAGVVVSENSAKLLGIADENGLVKLNLNEKKNICFTLLGFYDTCFIAENSTIKGITISLREKTTTSEEIVITSKEKNLTMPKLQSGVFEIKPDDYRNIPNIGGEADPMRMLQLSPGVSKTDVNMGLNVRGGSSDQNLVIIDDAVIYNPTHLAGFLSVFNPLIVNQITMLKSGIPSYYGGRLSSVIDVETQKDIPEKMHLKTNIGLIISGFSLQVPVLNKKIGVFISARKSYIDQTVKSITRYMLQKQLSMFNNTNYGFYDINLGVTIAPSMNDRIFISSYLGNDDFSLYKASFDVNTSLSWSNQAVSVKWTHHFNNRYIIKTIGYYSYNTLDLFMGQTDFNFNLSSKLSDFSIIHEHSLYFTKANLKIGVQFQKMLVTPNQSQAQLNSFEANFGTPNNFNTINLSPYLHSEYNFSNKLALSLGIRSSFYYHIGPYDKFIRGINQEITDTVHYNRNEVVAKYSNTEPRMGLRYKIDSVSSVKFSFTYNVQYLHQVNVTAVSFPTDFWMPSSYLLKPETGIQMSGGYFRNFVDNQYEGSVEVFYKRMNNLTEFNGGLLSSTTKATMEENLLEGSGYAYGLEFLLQKKKGKLSGWISYTLSRSFRKFAEINDGEPFPDKYDHIHDLSILMQYTINKKWKTAVVFIFATGSAYTLPNGRYLIEGNIVNQYGPYNSFRMPSYNRLDISFTRSLRKSSFSEQNLSINLYNVYSRMNPYFIYYKVTGDLNKYILQVTPKPVALFPFLPSINYEYRF
jgi:TonB-dependent Receptor Plug Domain